jgi:hypothetical protein
MDYHWHLRCLRMSSLRYKLIADGCIQLSCGFIYYLCFVGSGRSKFHEEYVRGWISLVQYPNEQPTRIQLEYEFTGYVHQTIGG